jgi:hypothetical protein
MDITLDPLFLQFQQQVNMYAVDVMNFTSTVITVMQFIERTGKMGGPQKKQWVLSVLRHIVSTHPQFTSDVKNRLLQDLETSIPVVIDEMINVANGVYVLSQVVKATGCCK